MQVRELEREIGAELVERRPGEIALTETGVEVAQRAERILAATRDLIDFARHRGVLSGKLRLGIIPTLAPYILPRVLPRLQRAIRSCVWKCVRPRPRRCSKNLSGGDLDTVMLALPADGADVETLRLFDDPFLLALPAADPLREAARRGRGRGPAAAHSPRGRTLPARPGAGLLRCGERRRPRQLGATSLATVMQMVANGYGVTLVPEVAAAAEVRDSRVKLLRFVEPEPARTIGLAWRRTSPRKQDFAALGEIVVATLGLERFPLFVNRGGFPIGRE